MTFAQYDELLYPSVYGLWAEPALLPHVTVHAGVVESCARGSDVFRPGVVAVADAVRAGLPVALVAERGVALGVGVARMGSVEMRAATSGSCVRVLHVVGDALFALGSRKGPDLDAEPTEAREQQHEPEPAAVPAEPLTPERADEQLERALVWALRLRVTKDALPLLVATFYAQHMQPLLGADAAALWKASSYKKLGALLAAAAPLVTVAEDPERGAGVLRMVALDRSAALYRRFPLDAAAEAAAPGDDEDALLGTAWVEELVSVPKRWHALVAEDEQHEAGCRMARKEARDMFLRRVKRLNALGDQGRVELDEALAAAWGREAGATLGMAEALQLWQDGLEPHHRVGVVGGGQRERKGPVRPLRVKEERRGGNKSVTLVEGLDDWLLDKAALAQELARRFASSTSVQDDASVLVQGARGADVATLLQQRYRVPAAYIVVTSAKPAKKKK